MNPLMPGVKAEVGREKARSGHSGNLLVKHPLDRSGRNPVGLFFVPVSQDDPTLSRNFVRDLDPAQSGLLALIRAQGRGALRMATPLEGELVSTPAVMRRKRLPSQRPMVAASNAEGTMRSSSARPQ